MWQLYGRVTTDIQDKRSTDSVEEVDRCRCHENSCSCADHQNSLISTHYIPLLQSNHDGVTRTYFSPLKHTNRDITVMTNHPNQSSVVQYTLITNQSRLYRGSQWQILHVHDREHMFTVSNIKQLGFTTTWEAQHITNDTKVNQLDQNASIPEPVRPERKHSWTS